MHTTSIHQFINKLSYHHITPVIIIQINLKNTKIFEIKTPAETFAIAGVGKK